MICTEMLDVCNVMFQIFIEYMTPPECRAASEALAGRKFASRVVVTSYYDPEKYYRSEFT